jgi:hypothetical protein
MQQVYAELGLPAGAPLRDVEAAWMRKNFALIKAGDEAGRAAFKARVEALTAHLKALEDAAKAAGVAENSPEIRKERADAYAVEHAKRDPGYWKAQEKMAWEDSPWNPANLESWPVRVALPPLMAGFAWLLHQTGLKPLLFGATVWLHEFGHATMAWLSGYRALPLPIGWTNIVPEKSNFVYFGIIFLAGVFAVAGWKERKAWPIVLTAVLLPIQFYLTWKMPEHRTDMWIKFAGIGGEFVLGALVMAMFFVHLPDKFKWGWTRYFFFMLAAVCFTGSYQKWRDIQRGDDEIPYGSAIHGEDDENGDMNALRHEYRWKEWEITRAYNGLATACATFLVLTWLVFALRIDRWIGHQIARLWPE